MIHQDKYNAKQKERDDENIESFSVTSESGAEYVPPFIFFFISGLKAGLYHDLGQINTLKTNNPLYASSIDQWTAKAITEGVIKIETDGLIKVVNSSYTFNKLTPNNLEKKLLPVSEVIQKCAIKQSKETPNNLSTLNVFMIENTPEQLKEYKQIVKDFYNKMMKLTEKSNQILPIDKIHYLTISTCTFDQETLNDI